ALRRCEKVLSDSFLRLALSQIDLYNLVELSSLRSDARSSVEEAVGCDPNNVRARRLLQKLR
ncbi:MAG TPA: hypothetical protein PLH57_06885, partial [Oligoflexia bacterium]|nr:hypothetical protein [Oligoflexia bacterium]